MSEIGIQLYFQVYMSDSVWGAEVGAGGERSVDNERLGGPGRDWGRKSGLINRTTGDAWCDLNTPPEVVI